MRRASDGEWFWRWADLPDPTGLQRFYKDRFLICNVLCLNLGRGSRHFVGRYSFGCGKCAYVGLRLRKSIVGFLVFLQWFSRFCLGKCEVTFLGMVL